MHKSDEEVKGGNMIAQQGIWALCSSVAGHLSLKV